MKELFSQLKRLGVSDGFVKVSNDSGEVVAMFDNGRIKSLCYKSRRKQ